MSALIEELRGMTEAGTADYTVGSTVYWSDNSMQDILDNHREDLHFQQLTGNPYQGVGGTLIWLDYRSPVGFFEQTTGGTAVFYLQDSTGATLGTSLYGVDYRRGVVIFNSDMRGTVVYLTGRTYDLNAAAAEMWRKKAAHYSSSSFNFSTDNHRIDKSQVYDHAVDQAKFFQGISRNAISTVERFRSDVW
jgi:hypothetical protein